MIVGACRLPAGRAAARRVAADPVRVHLLCAVVPSLHRRAAIIRRNAREGIVRHRCHALGCDRACPPALLMCGPCWGRVPVALQREVYRTVKLRGPSVDATWAPWWRAQARAIAAVAFVRDADAERHYLAHELAFADSLEAP